MHAVKAVDGGPAVGDVAAGTAWAPNAMTSALSDDEILNLGPRERTKRRPARGDDGSSEDPEGGALGDDILSLPERSAADDPREDDPSAIEERVSANPQMRRIWEDSKAYKEVFATPEEARSAKAQLSAVEAIDALFFSHRPEDHAELARRVAGLDPTSFALLAKAISEAAAGKPPDVAHAERRPEGDVGQDVEARGVAQQQFLQAANGAVVRAVLGAIESQLDRVLPTGVSETARKRVVGEIYREVDSSLQSNGEFARQIRDALQAGGLDTGHQDAIVSLVAGRARRLLPGATKKVLNEWTSTMVATHQDRRARQRAGESRIDIGGAGGVAKETRRAQSPRDIDYRRMSDSDILNL